MLGQIGLGKTRSRNKTRGASFVSCLVMLVVVFGGLVWAYFHFIENRYLEHPGQYLEVRDEYDGEFYNNYRNRMRGSLAGYIEIESSKMKKFLIDVKKGKFKDHWDRFKQRYHERVNRLRELAGEVNPRSVPAPYVSAHKGYCKALTHYYNCCNLLYEHMTAEEQDVKKAKLKEAIEEYRKGVKLQRWARGMFERVLK